MDICVFSKPNFSNGSWKATFVFLHGSTLQISLTPTNKHDTVYVGIYQSKNSFFTTISFFREHICRVYYFRLGQTPSKIYLLPK